MKKNNNSGMTIVEVLVSVVIISLVMSLLFTLLIQVQRANSATAEKSSLLISQAVITKAIEADMIEIGVHGVSLCEPSDFNFSDTLIDKSEGYVCVKLEYNSSYDIADLGYLMVYKQNADKYDNPSWVLRYERGYYDDCKVDQVPSGGDAWVGSYSVVQKLDSDISLSSDNKAVLSYSANYDSSAPYTEQRMNYASLNIPIYDSNEFHYDIDLSFSFKLYYPDEEAAKYQDRVDFFCDNTNVSSAGAAAGQLKCECSGNVCDNTLVSKNANKINDTDGSYKYVCTESKITSNDVVGLDKSFITRDEVRAVGITPSNVKSVTFQGTLTNPYPSKNQGVDVSYAKNKTSILYYNVTSNGFFDITIAQSGYVTMYGNSMAKMFSGFTNLESVNFTFFDSTGVINMSSLFKNCTKLKNSELKGFNKLDFSSVQNMGSMFNYCSSLTSSPFIKDGAPIELPVLTNAMSMFANSGISQFVYGTDFKAPNLEYTQYMLAFCQKLYTVKFEGSESSHLVLDKILDMSFMFKSSNNLSTVIFKYLDLPAIKNMEETFHAICYQKDAIDYTFEHINTPVLTNGFGMFNYNHKGYDKFHLLDWKTPSLQDVRKMFYESNFYHIDFSQFDFSHVTKATNLCAGTSSYESSLKTVIVGNDWYNITDLTTAFYYCTSLQGISLADGAGDTWNLNSVTSTCKMFLNSGSRSGNYRPFYMNVYLPICTNFTYMFYSSGFKFIEFNGVNSQLGSGVTIDCSYMYGVDETKVANGLNLRCVQMKNANFKGSVNCSGMFIRRTGLIFSLYDGEFTPASYYNDEYEMVSNPFENFTVDTGIVKTMSGMFAYCLTLKGLPDDFFTPFKVVNGTSLNKMFYQFGYNQPTGHINNKYGLVIPFTLGTSDWVDMGNMFNGARSVPFIRFTGNFSIGGAYTNMFAEVGMYSNQMDQFELDLTGLNVSWNRNDWYTHNFNSIVNDISAPVVIKLSTDSPRGKNQYCRIKASTFETYAKGGVTYVNNDSSWKC